jgi:hypothetical protein
MQRIARGIAVLTSAPQVVVKARLHATTHSSRRSPATTLHYATPHIQVAVICGQDDLASRIRAFRAGYYQIRETIRAAGIRGKYLEPLRAPSHYAPD